MEVYSITIAEQGEYENIPNGTSLQRNPSTNSQHSASSSISRNPWPPVSIERALYTQALLDEEFSGGPRKSKSLKERKDKLLQTFDCNTACMKSVILKLLPFIQIMRNYKVKRYLVDDLIAGLMVGIMNIPQGMAFAVLAGLDPVYGLYTSFFPALLYFFFGTSRQSALGVVAIMSLMVGKVVDDTDCSYPGDLVTTPSSPLASARWDIFDDSTGPPGAGDYERLCKIGAASAVTFVAGAMQIGMGMLQLGFVSVYLSEPLTRGFTTGVAFHVFTSQISTVFGISVQRYSGPGKLILTYIDLFKKISNVVWAAVVISIICIIILYITKEFLNPWVKKKIRIPVPIELFVVIAATLASYFGAFNENFNLSIVGLVPTGIETPRLPPTNRMSNMVADAFVMAVVSFATSVAQSEIFAKKHGYECDNNQEMLGLGISNFVSSFFNCYMSAASLSRSLVQDGTGGRTQVASLVSCLLLLIVLFFIGPLFETLPMCVLASIIIVALKNAFLRIKDLHTFWFISKIDWSIWFVTWISTVLLDIDWGLLVGVVYSLITTIARTQRAYSCVLGQVPETEIYKDISVYEKATELPGIKIFRFEAPLYYANQKHFVNKLFSKSGVTPQRLKVLQQKAKKKNREVPLAPITSVLIDCTMMGYVDSVGVSTLITVIKDYNNIDVDVLLAGCKGGVREMLLTANFYDHFEKHILFPSVHDAVLAVQQRKPEENSKQDKNMQLDGVYGSGEILLRTQL